MGSPFAASIPLQSATSQGSADSDKFIAYGTPFQRPKIADSIIDTIGATPMVGHSCAQTHMYIHSCIDTCIHTYILLCGQIRLNRMNDGQATILLKLESMVRRHADRQTCMHTYIHLYKPFTRSENCMLHYVLYVASVSICMYVCIYVCMYMCVYVCMYVGAGEQCKGSHRQEHDRRGREERRHRARYIHTYIHTYIYTPTSARPFLLPPSAGKTVLVEPTSGNTGERLSLT